MLTPQPYPLFIAAHQPTDAERLTIVYGRIIGWRPTPGSVLEELNAAARNPAHTPQLRPVVVPVVVPVHATGRTAYPAPAGWSGEIGGGQPFIGDSLAEVIALCVARTAEEAAATARGSALRTVQLAQEADVRATMCRHAAAVSPAAPAAYEAMAWQEQVDRLLNEAPRVGGWTKLEEEVLMPRAEVVTPPEGTRWTPWGLHAGKRMDDEHGLDEGLGTVIVVGPRGDDWLAVAGVHTNPRYVLLRDAPAEVPA